MKTPYDRYRDQYASFLKGFLAPQKPLRVVFDFSNGPAGLIVSRILRGNERIIPFFQDATVSGAFPAHGPNPLVSRGLFHLHQSVLAHRADLGIIFDADGDRAFFVDHKGRWVPPHLAAYCLAREFTAPYVFDTRTALALRYAGLDNNLKYVVSRVGSVFIKEAMRRQQAGFGAEYSGHYYFREFLSVDSGILAAISLMNAVTKLPYTLAEFVDLAPHKVEFEERNIHAAASGPVVKGLIALLKPGARRTRRTEDGVSIEADSWFATVRASNTEPLVRVCVGAIDTASLRAKRAVLTAAHPRS